MAMEKVSLTLDEAIVRDARALAGGRGLSGFVNEAIKARLDHLRLRELLDDLEAKAGPIPADVREEVMREWPDELVPKLPRRRRR